MWRALALPLPAENMIRRWCFFLTLVLGCVTLDVFYQGWLAWLLLMALVFLPVLSLIVSLPAMLTARVKVDVGGWMVMGTKAALRVKASCLFPMPSYRCRIRVKRAITGESWLLKAGEPLPTEHCGQLICKAEKCWIYDYLGLFRLKMRKTGEQAVTVRPVPVKMGVPSDLERHMAKSWRPKMGGGFAENHDLRLYRPGDKLNQLHWKLTAKTGKLMVREAMEPLRSRLLLMMDLNGTADELDRKLGRLQWLGDYLLNAQQQFEAAVLTGDGLRRYTVATQQEHLKALDSILQAAPAKDGSVSYRTEGSDWCILIGGGTDEEP